MKRSFIPVVAFLSIMAVAAPAMSSAANLKIGVVDYGRLMQDSPQGKAETKKLRDKFGPRNQKIVTEEQKIKKLQDDIDKNGAVMSSSALQDKQSELSELQRDLSRKQSDLQDDINVEKSNAINNLQALIGRAVTEFAKKNHYNLIIGGGVYYADDTVNVTAQVLAQMQQDYKSKKSGS